MNDRKRIKPIDGADWTMDMTDEIAEFLVSPSVVEKYKSDYHTTWASTWGVKIAIIVDKHIHKNGYELRKIEKSDETT